MSQDKKYREFWIFDFRIYLSKEEAEKIKNLHIRSAISGNNNPSLEFYKHRDIIQVIEIAALDELKAALRDMVGALERQQSPHIEQFCKERAREALAKHADLIEKLKGE